MTQVIYVSSALEAALLIVAATADVAARIIPNCVCLLIGGLGVGSRLLVGPEPLGESLAAAGTMFLVLLVVYVHGWIGGGDAKLLLALAVGLPVAGILRLLTTTLLSGGVLAMVHLVMRRLPLPQRPPAGSSLLRRIYVVERWRNVRGAPLPYGVAIAFGGISVLLHNGV